MKIIIVDDDVLVSAALKTILEASGELQVLATGNDGSDAILLYQKFQPDILLMDIRMQKMNGLTATEEILRQFPAAKILLLTTFSDDEYIVKALRLGAKGYLLKQDYANILPALKSVASGQTVFGHEIMEKLPGLIQRKNEVNYDTYDISERELDIIRLIADGYSNKEIASELFLSEGTVRNYLSSILEKLHLRDRTQVAIFYLTGKFS